MSSQLQKQSKRKNLELTIRNLQENELFIKHTSPLAGLSDLKMPPTPLHFAIIELLSTEVTYCEDLKYLKNVYSGLLSKSADYENILMQREKDLLFQNVWQLQILSGLYESEASGQALVLGADLKRLNLGSLISQELCDNKEYRTQTNSYIVTQQFRLRLLEHKTKNGGVLFNRWLQESDLYCTRLDRTGEAVSLQNLLSKPIQRLSQYPLLLKRILDEGEQIWTPIQQHELSVCLIKFNHMLDSCNQSIPVENWSDCEKLIFEENELYSSVDHDKLVAEFQALVGMLGGLLEATESLCSSILKFSNESCKYARAWNEVCSSPVEDGSTLSGVELRVYTPYESYCDKCSTQLRTSIKVVAQEFEDRIVKRLRMAVVMCEEAKNKISQRQKLSKSYTAYAQKKENCSRSAQKYILLDNKLKDQLPKLKVYIEDFCIGIETEIVKALLQWIESYVGQSSLVRYRHVSEIVQQYRETIRMSGMKLN